MKFNVGILGATGMVGQNYLRLLDNHPWFEVVYLAASSKSAGLKYEDAVKDRWNMSSPIPDEQKNIVVQDVMNIKEAKEKCDFVFSAFELSDKKLIKEIEEKYAKSGIPVISNSSANRWTPDVPMIIPEINSEHLDIIKHQKKNNKWNNGFIIVKPNCSLQSYLTPVYALIEAGYPIKNIILTTMQAVSGAGYPGVSSLDMIDNVVPFINGEEEKTEKEPLKILGKIKGSKIINNKDLKISASCNRVPVIDGHLATVNILFSDKKPTKKEIIKIWNNFKSDPQKLNLPFAPKKPILYKDEIDRPQPKKDRDNSNGMAVTVGRLRDCDVFDYKFVSLSHNTVRGAAGGGILNAELAYKKGWLKKEGL